MVAKAVLLFPVGRERSLKVGERYFLSSIGDALILLKDSMPCPRDADSWSMPRVDADETVGGR
jgi:hypothetical protein